MKTRLILAALTLVVCSVSAQTLQKQVGQFKRIIVSPRINLVMIAGETESVKVSYANVDESKINITVKNRTLRIYLDGSRVTEKQERIHHDGWIEKKDMYRNASITAYVTYKKVNKLVVRGEQEVDVQTGIDNKKFKLAAYGECDITLASLQTGKFKASLYGQHNLKIKSGEVETQKYKLFGENKIDAQALQSDEVASTTYGESRLKFNAKESCRLVTLGESDVTMKGGADINRITFGQVKVTK